MANALRKVYEDVWKRAFKDGEVRLSFRTKTAAHAARWGLYAVKPERCGEDLELQMARENCSITWVGELTIAILRTDRSSLFFEITEQLPQGSLASAVEASLGAFDEKASMARVMALVAEKDAAEAGKMPVSEAVLNRAKSKFGAR